MSYRTELMEKILTSPQGQRIVQYCTPMYGEAYVILWLLQVIGSELDKTASYVEDLALQVTPQTATWTIDFWEKEYGIVPESSWSLEQRQQNIVSQMSTVLPMNPARLASVISNSLGVPVEIMENVAKNTFLVNVREYVEDIAPLVAIIEQVKPAHLIYQIRIAMKLVSEIDLKAAIALTYSESYKVEVQN